MKTTHKTGLWKDKDFSKKYTPMGWGQVGCRMGAVWVRLGEGWWQVGVGLGQPVCRMGVGRLVAGYYL